MESINLKELKGFSKTNIKKARYQRRRMFFFPFQILNYITVFSEMEPNWLFCSLLLVFSISFVLQECISNTIDI